MRNEISPRNCYHRLGALVLTLVAGCALALPAEAETLLFAQRLTLPAGSSLDKVRLTFLAPPSQPPPNRDIHLVAFTVPTGLSPDCSQPIHGATPLLAPGTLSFDLTTEHVYQEGDIWVGIPPQAMIWKEVDIHPPLDVAHTTELLVGYEVLTEDFVASRVRPAFSQTDDFVRSTLYSCDGGLTFHCLGAADFDQLFAGGGTCPIPQPAPCEPFVRFDMDASDDPR